jgi:hypothetical protein
MTATNTSGLSSESLERLEQLEQIVNNTQQGNLTEAQQREVKAERERVLIQQQQDLKHERKEHCYNNNKIFLLMRILF